MTGRPRRLLLCLAAGMLLLPLGPPAASGRPGTDADFGPAVARADDAALFLNIAARYFDRDPGALAALAADQSDPDDLATGLFVAARADVAPAKVFALRRDRLSWWEISTRLRLPADVWFLPTRSDPGPPYGKAYGWWRQLREERAPFPGLDDLQARDLVAVRLLSEYFAVPVETAMAWRAGGRGVRALAGEEYRRRHGPAREGGKRRP